jgi:subtilisin family serine protease
VVAARGPARPATSAAPIVQVVVELAAPPRTAAVDAQQRAVERRIRTVAPEAEVRWRYRTVLNAFSVVVPENTVSRIERLAGVREVYPSVRFSPALERSVPAIRANAVWGPGLSTSGQGVKIGILDDGVDQTHPFFSPAGYAMPAGYPKGVATHTTAKVIAARVFPPASPKVPFPALPFHPNESSHGTHVAGIAAGNPGTQASIGGGRVTLSGVAPRAFIGNYRVMTVPTITGLGLNGNSPEIAAGIEAAVRDGMDVINLSLGEAEISPGRDLVVRAIEGAAAAGVVPVISAGNEFGNFGRGSIASPGSSPSAITVGAATVDARISDFSSAGPTPVTHQLKPEVSAPGVQILSSVPAREGTWSGASGTSMAAPHTAGAAALLTQRHPSWTVAQIKSALTLTARPALDGAGQATTTRGGAGFIDVAAADQPLVFAEPTAVSFGHVTPGSSVMRAIAVADAGGGAGPWAVSHNFQQDRTRVTITTSPALAVPGSLSVQASVQAGPSAPEGDVTGFVVLSRPGVTRQIPFWLRIVRPKLTRHRARTLVRNGTYRGNTRGRAALVSTYRYPENPTPVGVARTLAGPEQVFRVNVRRPVENFGVAILTRTAVQPRIVQGKDENRQAGATALPLRINPYVPTFFERAPIAGVVRPANGTYHVVFDSPTRSGAGRFRFRFWVDDRTPPRVRLVTRSVRRGLPVVAAAVDRGAGVDPAAVYVQIDGGPFREASFRDGRVRAGTSGLSRGRHRITFHVSDRQEAKNMENVLRVLPNTTSLSTTFVVR